MTGLIYVFTGEGKGKTSAALGIAVRSALITQKVCWISWYKGHDWDLAEKHLPDKLSQIEMHFVGRGFMIPRAKGVGHGNKTKYAKVGGGAGVVVDTASGDEHRAAATQGLHLAEEKLTGGKYFLLVLDEILNAIDEGLLTESLVLSLLKRRGATHVVLTGRGVTDPVIQVADLVTECKKIKHPYDQGKLAVRGLDF